MPTSSHLHSNFQMQKETADASHIFSLSAADHVKIQTFKKDEKG